MKELTGLASENCPHVVLWVQAGSMTSAVTCLLHLIEDEHELHVHQAGSSLEGALMHIDPTVIVLFANEAIDILPVLSKNQHDAPLIIAYANSLSNQDKLHAFRLGVWDVLSLDEQSGEEIVARIRHHSGIYLRLLELKSQRDALQKNLHMLRRKARVLNEVIVHDPLTGVSNRLHVDWVLEHEWQRGMRHARSLSVLMIDVDCFKEFNDYYGHQAGDQCLINIAQSLARVVKRPSDLVGRYGGEEFIVLLPETPIQGGIKIAEGILREVEALKIEHARSRAAAHVTVSIGLASMIPDHELHSSLLIEQADRALYLAKETGRNCLRVWGMD